MKYCAICQYAFPENITKCPHDKIELSVGPLNPNMIVVGGRYQLKRELGGGMSTVFEAKDLALVRKCAIKILTEDDERLRKEAQILSKLDHENAVKVYDLAVLEDGRSCIVMEFLEGTDLSQLLQRRRPLSVFYAVPLMKQVASALDAAHARGICHRDIKPANILVKDNLTAKVIDFGIARTATTMSQPSSSITAPTAMAGTIPYMSPEQIRCEKVDARSDLFSLGVVFFEIITGHLPFQGQTLEDIIRQHQFIPKPPHELCPELQIPKALSMIVIKLLETEREKRYQTAAELIQSLSAFEEHDNEIHEQEPSQRETSWLETSYLWLKRAGQEAFSTLARAIEATGKKTRSFLSATRAKAYSIVKYFSAIALKLFNEPQGQHLRKGIPMSQKTRSEQVNIMIRYIVVLLGMSVIVWSLNRIHELQKEVGELNKKQAADEKKIDATNRSNRASKRQIDALQKQLSAINRTVAAQSKEVAELVKNRKKSRSMLAGSSVNITPLKNRHRLPQTTARMRQRSSSGSPGFH